jgi:hypothetical protein
VVDEIIGLFPTSDHINFYFKLMGFSSQLFIMSILFLMVPGLELRVSDALPLNALCQPYHGSFQSGIE